MKQLPTSLYIHIPFCRTICAYCDFCKYYNYPKLMESYYPALLEELRHVPVHPMKTIYIGGGTPSCIPNEMLEDLLIHLEPYFSDEMEFTIECNVEDIDEELLVLLKRHSVNRLSIGLQTFQYSLLEKIGRSVGHVEEKIRLAKQYFQNINVDLMYALPGETLDDLQEDLQKFLALDVPHISCYSLILEENTVFSNQHVTPVDEDTDFEMYQMITKTLTDAGYLHYEVSNYAKAGYESKHNLVYWHNEEYYGIGLGASSYVNGYRMTNTRSLNHYQEGNIVTEREFVSIDDQMDYEMILGLRTLKGVSISHFFQKYRRNITDIYDIVDLLENQLLVQKGDYLAIPEDKIYISNTILVQFLRRDLSG